MDTISSISDTNIDRAIEVYQDLDRALSVDRDLEELLDRPRVLIVDDSSTVRALIRKALKERYECSEAETVLDAFDQLKMREFDVVIADIIIPGLSGIELLRKAVEEYPNVSVIMVSGVDRPQRALDALRLGAFDYIIKPFDPYSLELTVDRAVDRRRLLIRAERYKNDLEHRNRELAKRKVQLETLQVQIMQSEKMASLGRLAAGIAHEVNNPVGFIFSNLDLLEKDFSAMRDILAFFDAADLPDEVRKGADDLRSRLRFLSDDKQTAEMIRDCMDGARRIKDIVQNLRTFSRLDDADVKRSDINEGIESTIRLLSRYFSDAKVRLTRDYGEIPLVEGFAGQLNQVWMNVLANAAQALPPNGGSVNIRTRRVGDSVMVEISDTGMGISKADLDRIFDPFFTTKDLGEGTGLGLSISFGIIKKHDGTITAASEPEIGTTFMIQLPLVMKRESIPSS